MRAQLGLLEHIIRLWDSSEKKFRVGEHILTLEINVIYFITSVSQRGDHITLVRKRTSGIPAETLICRHCVPRTQKSSGKNPITAIKDIPLKEVLYSYTREVRSVTSYVATKTQMIYAWDCMEP